MTKALAKSLHSRICNTISASETQRTVELIRRKMRLKEGHAKCYLKKIELCSKGTLRHVSRPRTQYPPPPPALTHCTVYTTVYMYTCMHSILKAGSLKMNTALEYSTRVVQEGGRRCKKSTLNDLVHLTPLRIPLMNPPLFTQGKGGEELSQREG
jgi:hypothetical protein